MNSTHKTLTRTLLLLPLVCAAFAASLSTAPSARAAACPPPPPPARPFAQWGDNNSYVLSSGGGFEAGPNQWSLSAGASIVQGNEPWKVHNASDQRSLLLPARSSATSAPTCAPMITSIVRFFAMNAGALNGLLHVELLVNGGKDGILDGGTISAPAGWSVTPQIQIPWPHPLGGAVQLQVRLTPLGASAAFDVDDVYIDPLKNH